MVIRSLHGVDPVGADAPCCDPTGMTSVIAANVMFELARITTDRWPVTCPHGIVACDVSAGQCALDPFLEP